MIQPPPPFSIAMTMSILRYQDTDATHESYRVTFFEDNIFTTVTATPSCVDGWISYIESQYHRHLHPIVVGLDVEWRPNFIPNQEHPVATLQLCVGDDCLIFQILHSPTIPWSLMNFLRNPSYTFTGVGIDDDVEKLMRHWDLEVANTADIRALAAEEYGMRDLRNAGLKGLTRMVLGKELVKVDAVRRSRWDNQRLYPAQVQYACIDAFLSYKIGRILIHRT